MGKIVYGGQWAIMVDTGHWMVDNGGRWTVSPLAAPLISLTIGSIIDVNVVHPHRDKRSKVSLVRCEAYLSPVACRMSPVVSSRAG